MTTYTNYTNYDCEIYLDWDTYISLNFNDLYKDCINKDSIIKNSINKPITEIISENYKQEYNPILIHIKNENCIIEKQVEIKTKPNLHIIKRKPKTITPESKKDSKWKLKRINNTILAKKNRNKEKQKRLFEIRNHQDKMKSIKIKLDYLITYIKELKLKKLLLCEKLYNSNAFTTSLK